MSDLTLLPQIDGMMQTLERLARDPQIPTERITELFRLAERRETAMMRRIFFTDMNAMQMELTQIHRDKPNPAFHSRYATETEIDAAARPIYTKYGFSITFGTAPATTPGNIMVTCTVAHRSGFHETHALEGPISTEGSQGRRAGATPIQAVGIAVTYLKRTLIKMVLNLVTTDDPADNDGNTLKGDPLADWVDRFEQAAEALTDSDAADALMNRDTVLAQTRSMPPGPQRDRFMQLREEVTQKWLRTASHPAQEAPTENV